MAKEKNERISWVMYLVCSPRCFNYKYY
jgi:hypothetical protein